MFPFLLLAAMGVLFVMMLAAPSRADIIITNTGGRYEGTITGEDEDSITIKTKYGVHTILRDDIAEIRPGTFRDEYEKKLEDLKTGDINGMYDLAIWCRKNTLRKEYKELIKQILEFMPEHSDAKREWETIKISLPPTERKKYDKEEKKPTPAPVRRVVPKPKPEKALTADEKKRIKALIGEYFAAAEIAAREEVLAKLKKFDPIPKAQVKKYEKDIFKKAMSGPKIKGAGRLVLQSEKYPGHFILSIPGRRMKKYPLLIGLHGGGQGSGAGSSAARQWGASTGMIPCISVFPTVIQKVGTAWNTEREECYVMEIIAQAKRSFPIDTNRIYLCGHSMGGYGTWAIGSRYADVFAAISPNAGGIFMMRGAKAIARGVVPNMKNTPVYFYHGTNDPKVPADSDRIAAEQLKELKSKYGPYDYVFKEYGGIGHGYPPGGLGPIIKWLGTKKRKPYPKMVIWEPTRSYKRIFYWLKVTGGSRRRIIAKRSGNTFEVEGITTGFSIFMNRKMINPAKPVIVKVGGKEVFNGLVQPSLSALVETIADKADREQYFTYRIDL
jgi:pimeloyl-ACP methyl ester carboxylesterase